MCLVNAALPLLALLLLFAACDTQNEPTVCATDLEHPDNPRVVFGEGLDGVRMLELAETVEQKLGPPAYHTIPDWCAVYDGFAYENGLFIYFLFRMRGDSSAVGWMRAIEPYAGTTPEGVGIGTSREDFECIYGDTGGERGFTIEDDRIAHVFTFDDDSVSAIQLFSLHIPPCFGGN